MKNRKSLVFVLCALAGAMTLSCSDDNKSENAVSAELTVDVSTMQLKEGDTQQFTINYNPATDLVVTSSNAECVSLDGQENKIVTTNGDSNVSVNVTAVGQDCTAVITVVDRGDATISKTIQVTVEATQQEPPVQDKSELIVTPESLELVPEGNNLINIAYAAKTDLLITSSVPDCVKVNDADEVNITTNGEGKADVKASAVGQGCKSIISVVDKDDLSIFKKVYVQVLEAGDAIPVLTVTPDALELHTGASDSVTATYTLESGTPLTQKKLTLESNNPACAAPELAQVETDDNGNANIKITAMDAGSCNAMITVIPPMGSNKTIAVSVYDGEGPGPVLDNPSLAFDPESLSIVWSEKKGNIVLNYRDGNGDGIADANITFDYDETCVKSDKIKKANTDENGQVAIVLTAQRDDCSTTLTAKSGELTASADIKVSPKDEFAFTLETAIDESYHDKIGYLAAGTSDQSCTALTEVGLVAAAEAAVDEQVELNGTSPILSTHPMTEVPIAQKSVLVIGKSEPSSKVTKAYGCKDISAADDGQTVHLDLISIPPVINGTYSVVTNFDFTDAIQPSSEVFVEKMTGGDWLKFLLNFVEDPVDAIITLLWNNSFERLKTVDDDNIQLAMQSFMTFGIDLVALHEQNQFLSDYMKSFTFQFEGAEKSSYDLIVKDMSPVVADLSRNMQLLGTMEIAETDNVSAIHKGNEKFTEVQYIWPFTTNKACIPDVYGKADVKCRNRMQLAKVNDGNVQSVDWTGSWADEKMNINTHSISFKWASILASTILIEIMPAVFDYKGNNNYKKGKYFSAFVDKFGFDLIIAAYKKKNEEDSERYPFLKLDTSLSICTKAMMELTYVSSETIVNNANKYISANIPMTLENYLISIFDGHVCPYLTKLDDYAWPALATIESSTDNALTLEAKDCALNEFGLDWDYSFDGYYTRMGIPDEPVVTAHEVFGEDKKSSSRCTWELKNGAMDKTVNGLFHSMRTK